MTIATDIEFRIASASELQQILALIADDDLGKSRENISTQIADEYQIAFDDITADPNNELIVGMKGSEVIAVLQITYIPNLTLKGSKRAQIEGVRISSQHRGQGLGQKLFDFAFNRARDRNCKIAQLTTNKIRTDAIRFYEKLGFASTHEGMKASLE